MNIVNKKPNMRTFGNVTCGTVFKDEHSNICMKIEYHDNVNVVYLCDGSLAYIDDLDKVEIVGHELVIES